MMSNPIVTGRPTQAGIDAKNDVGSPVDYSFKNLTAFDGMFLHYSLTLTSLKWPITLNPNSRPI